MSPCDFYNLEPREFYNKTKGFFEQRNEDTKQAWEIMRFQTTALINIQVKRSDKIEPNQLVKFPWDKDQQKRTMSVKEFEALIGA